MYRNFTPGISKIQVVRCKDLQPNVMLRSICGNIVTVAAPSKTISFCGKPVLTWEGTRMNSLLIERATLEFNTASPLPGGENLAFVVTSLSGAQYLVGTREGRFPVVTYSETTGVSGGDAAVRKYKITHLALKSVLPCIL